MIDPTLKPVATVLITTKDRKADLERAIGSVVDQTANVELIVVDDGSGDGTSELVAERFPDATLVRNKTSLGIIGARNRAADLAKCNILFTLDDDAIFSDISTIERALPLFDHERVGVVSIPLMNFHGDKQAEVDFVDNADMDDFPCLYTYSGGANAKRLDLFKRLGSYSGGGRQGEESGYSIRMLDAGFVVRATSLPPVHHFPNDAKKLRAQIVYHSARNTFLFAWQFVPLSRLALHWSGVVRNQLRFGLRERRLRSALAGLAAGVGGIPSVARRPVSMPTYSLFRRMIREGPVPISEVQRQITKTTAEQS